MWIYWWVYTLENWFGLAAILWVEAVLFAILVLVPFVDRSPKRHWKDRKIQIRARRRRPAFPGRAHAADAGHRAQEPHGMNAHQDSTQKARRWFWGLTVIAIVAAGSLSRAVLAGPGVVTGLRVLGSGLVLVVAGSLALRLLIALSPGGSVARQRRLSLRKAPRPARGGK